jgi:preprotein translocase subunit SecG
VSLSIFTIILLLNSFVTISLILNQNESAKDAASNANSANTEISNPLQNITWVCVILEFILLLLKSKMNDF